MYARRQKKDPPVGAVLALGCFGLGTLNVVTLGQGVNAQQQQQHPSQHQTQFALFPKELLRLARRDMSHVGKGRSKA